ncbi:hypothetical protein [Streptantibioticus silvisoli]|uniref:Sulfotransferase family protein n=1 Tax=Streptantibioticus silvisoli TaxID=2705255 RepID=A0ABT6W177_9ACTN|nr:hypothetical protein [Streptantibioticus silvisoli]MDI5964150.1 hypothetical protein [Streptantibioticus silvisoli]
MPAEENLAELARAGYLPADIDLDDGVVLLAKLAHSGFQEVWYSDTVAGVDAGDHKVVPFRAFVEQFADRRDDEHLRLIAHTSRCGSTLLANLLTLRPTTMVLKEPDFVTVPARRIALAADAAEAADSAALLRALMNFSCHAAAVAGRELVIKLTSWITPLVVAALNGSEHATWLFVWREPEEVVASNVAQSPSWGRDTEDGRAARYLAGVADTPLGSVEFYANTWQRIVDSFGPAGTGIRWRTLEYRELAGAKAESLVATESWFGLAAAGGLPAAFEEESKRYSKGSRAEVFEPANAHRRSPLEPDEQEQVDVLTKRALETLRAETDHRLLP